MTEKVTEKAPDMEIMAKYHLRDHSRAAAVNKRPAGDALTVMPYQGLSLISGMGAHVKKTVTRRKERLPHTSERAPIRGADMNDSRPWTRRGIGLASAALAWACAHRYSKQLNALQLNAR